MPHIDRQGRQTYDPLRARRPTRRPARCPFVQIASATRQYFQADQNDPVASFIAEAGQHPVFELTPIDPR
jgi:hypothetical protein